MKYFGLCGHFVEIHFLPSIEAREDLNVVMVRTHSSAQPLLLAKGSSHFGSEYKLASLWLNAQL